MRTEKEIRAMTKYNVDDMRNFLAGLNLEGSNTQTIEANSPLEAVKKAYPNCKITRDYTGKIGDIVVGRFTKQRYGRGYRTYVYNIEQKNS